MPNITYKSCYYLFTCRYFKLSWNTTALSQSNCRNFSCSSISKEIESFYSNLLETNSSNPPISMRNSMLLSRIYKFHNYHLRNHRPLNQIWHFLNWKMSWVHFKAINPLLRMAFAKNFMKHCLTWLAYTSLIHIMTLSTKVNCQYLRGVELLVSYRKTILALLSWLIGVR